MHKMFIPERELFDEKKREFIHVKEHYIQLEHSLVSISKWESKWHRPFLSKEPMTMEQTIDYVKCMTITQNVDPNLYYGLNNSELNEISEYINNPMSATWFNEAKQEGSARNSGETVTSELIYFWMTSYRIPFSCEKWHLNRLLNLIHICNIKNAPPKKMSKRDILNRNRALNAARRKQTGSKG